MSHGEGAAPAANPGQVPGPLEWDGAGGQDLSTLPQPSFSRQSPAQPAPCGGWRRAASHGCTPGSGVQLSHSSQWPAASSHGLRDSLFHSVAPGLSPFPTARHTGHGVPGNFVQFPSLQGLWGKPERVEAALHGRAPEHPVPGRAGLWSLQRGMYGTAPGRRQLPAHSQHLCRHEGPRKVPLPAGASLALHVLLFRG